MPQTGGFTLFDLLEDQPGNIFSRPKRWGEAIPREEWEEGEFYRNLRNTVWREITEDNFPATSDPDKRTHTLYVLSVSGFGIRICPTTTCFQYTRPCAFIPRGMKLDGSDRALVKDVYVLTLLAYPLPAEKLEGEEDLFYAGRYPFAGLQELD